MIDRSAMTEMPQAVPLQRAPPRDAPSQVGGFERLLGTTTERDPATPRDGNALEVLFDDRDGHGQSIVLPWRLFANDALSQVLKAHATDAATLDTPDAMRLVATRASAPASIAGVRVPLETMTTMAVDDAQTLALPAMPNARSVGGAREAASAPPTVAPSMAEPWQTRLLRWLENADGGLVARLRDYRLDTTTQTRFVEQLLTFAREHGLNLQRVVVNAREVWRAPH
jgi:hypothetical protein